MSIFASGGDQESLFEKENFLREDQLTRVIMSAIVLEYQVIVSQREMKRVLMIWHGKHFEPGCFSKLCELVEDGTEVEKETVSKCRTFALDSDQEPVLENKRRISTIE